MQDSKVSSGPTVEPCLGPQWSGLKTVMTWAPGLQLKVRKIHL